MSFSFSSLVRLIVLLAIGTTMLAIGLSRLDPPRPGMRTFRAVKHTNINEFFLNNVTDRTPYWLDAETGSMTAHPLEDGDVLETATCSPWVDEKNQRQVVGRWTTRTKDGPLSMTQDFGIARYLYPSGQMLDHVSTEIVPLGPPCWYPETRARVLFAAGDGMLYNYSFEPESWAKSTNDKPGRDPKPWPIAWRCAKPGNGQVFLGDISWPEDPRMGGCLVVSLREQASKPDALRFFTKTTLWWLKLNFAGTEIVDTGRLLVTDKTDESDLEYDHRNPTVGTLPDGRLALAYLRQRTGGVGWELRAVPIEFETENRVPRAVDSRSVLLASRCQPSHPTFTSDGRYLNAMAGPEAKNSQVLRISLSGRFPKSE